MEIIIGRDTQTSKLSLTVDGKPQAPVGSGALPDCVASQHCKLTINNGQMRLQNLDINNYTYINGQSIESKAVSMDDKIELGIDHHLLDWNLLKPYLPLDIRHLRKIWEDYEAKNLKLQIKERKFNALRSATGLITMLAIALSIAGGGRNKWYLMLYAIAIIVSVAFFIKAYIDSSKLPQKRQELIKQFQRDYVCPHCGHFMGNQSYDILAQNGSCPYCKKTFHT